MEIKSYHGAGNTVELHPGICLTDSFRSAAGYAADKNSGYDDTPIVATIELDTTGLTVVELDEGLAYDGDGNWIAPGDNGTADADIVIFGDRGMSDETHETIRLMTPAAVAAARIIETVEVER